MHGNSDTDCQKFCRWIFALRERTSLYIYIKKSYTTIPGKEDFKKEARFEAMADNRRKSLP